MAGTAVLGRLNWLVATVGSVIGETATVATIALEAPDWPGHRAGQHLDVRLTAEDGYVAERSYSIASAPGEPLAITVERLDDGEVSPYLTQELRAGDQLELRGPIGGYFVWEADRAGTGPLLLLAGGSGIVPLRSILRHRQLAGSSVPARLVYSARSARDLIYRAELDGYGRDAGVEVTYTLTRQQPAGLDRPLGPVGPGHAGRAGLAGGSRAAGVRVRAHALCRVRGDDPGRARLRGGAGQDGAVRRDGRTLMDAPDGAAFDGSALDGNAIGGLLHEIFGAEMTTAAGTCLACGTTGPVAECVVYLRAPGTVVRCPACASVLMVVVRRREMNCVDLQGLASLEPASHA